MQNNKNNMQPTEEELHHLTFASNGFRLKKKNPLPPKNAFDPIFLPLRSTVMCPVRLGGDSSGGSRGERARGNAVECAGEEKGGSEPSKWLWKGFFFSSSSLRRHLELSFVSRVWVYSVLLGQPTGTDARQSLKRGTTHTYFGERVKREGETEQVQDVLVSCSLEWRSKMKEE